MEDHIQYTRRVTVDEEEVSVSAIREDGASAISISANGTAEVFGGMSGVNLVSVMSSIHAAASQGGEAMAVVDGIRISTNGERSWIGRIEMGRQMFRRTAETLEIVLMDATGEYRRKVRELERA